MERLNDIMGRAAQRRQQYSEQRSSTHNQQGQRSAPQGTHPPLREQNARLGQQRLYTSQPTRIQQEPTNYEANPYGTPPATRPKTTRPPQPANSPERMVTPRPTTYQPQRSERPSVQQAPVVHPMQTRPMHSYHHADEYAISPIVQADVIEDWEDDEDDEAGMQYGDWEEGENEVVLQQPPTPVEPRQPPRGRVTSHANNDYEQVYHPLVTRELSRPSTPEPQSYATRSFRDVPNAQPPVPQTRVQEIHQHRSTQPLDPRVVAPMGRNGQTQMQQRPLRQIVSQPKAQVREQAVMAYAPAQLPQVAPLAPAKSVCPRCKGAGYLRANVPFGHPNFGKPIACECKEAEKKEKRRQQLLELSDLGAFRAKSLANFSTRTPGMHPSVQEAFEVAQDYAHDPYGWLLLVGPNGCGKTHLAAAIANQCLDSGSMVLFAVVPDLLAHLRAAFAPTAPEGYDQLFAKMREAELLVLDDLGAHQSSPWASEKLFQLLNYRYNSQYPTVITANKSGLSSIDDRVLSRLSDVSLVNSVIMDGAPDYRRRNPRRD